MADYSNSSNFTEPITNITQNSTSEDIQKYIRRGKPFITFKGFIILLIDIFMVTGPSLGYFLQSLSCGIHLLHLPFVLFS